MEKIMVDLGCSPIVGLLPSLERVLKQHPDGMQVAVGERPSLEALCRLAGKMGYQLRILQLENRFYVHILK